MLSNPNVIDFWLWRQKVYIARISAIANMNAVRFINLILSLVYEIIRIRRQKPNRINESIATFTDGVLQIDHSGDNKPIIVITPIVQSNLLNFQQQGVRIIIKNNEIAHAHVWYALFMLSNSNSNISGMQITPIIPKKLNLLADN